MQRNPRALRPYGDPAASGPTWIDGGGPTSTGANDEPMGERKRKRCASTPDPMIVEASETPTKTGGAIETSIQPANGQNGPRNRLYTPETIYLDSSSPEICMAPGNVDGPHTTKNRNEKKTSTPATAKSLAAESSSSYVCKRCNREGHRIQHCPTNLDPNFDVPPDPDYKCDFCKKSGDHFAALCPRNRQSWSLNEQRRLAARAESLKTRTRNKPRSQLNIDSYRPGDCSPLRDSHKDFPRNYKASSAKAAARKLSPQSREKHVSKKARKRRSKDSCHPAGLPRIHDESVYKSSRSDTLVFDSRTDGRLSYENWDVFMIDSSPVSTEEANDPCEPLEGTLNHFDGLTIHNSRVADEACPGGSKQAAEEAENFLRSLLMQIQEDERTAACVAEMELILDEVSGHDERCDPTLVVDGEGQRWRAITNPPYDNSVVGLFGGRHVPIVNPRVDRQTAANMTEELDIKAALGGAEGRL